MPLRTKTLQLTFDTMLSDEELLEAVIELRASTPKQVAEGVYQLGRCHTARDVRILSDRDPLEERYE